MLSLPLSLCSQSLRDLDDIEFIGLTQLCSLSRLNKSSQCPPILYPSAFNYSLLPPVFNFCLHVDPASFFHCMLSIPPSFSFQLSVIVNAMSCCVISGKYVLKELIIVGSWSNVNQLNANFDVTTTDWSVLAEETLFEAADDVVSSFRTSFLTSSPMTDVPENVLRFWLLLFPDVVTPCIGYLSVMDEPSGIFTVAEAF